MWGANAAPRGVISSMAERLAVFHDPSYADWVFHSSHPTQGRRFTKALDLVQRHAADAGVEVEILSAPAGECDRSLLELVHDRAYVRQVLDDGICGEWSGERPDLGRIAHTMVIGTLTAAEALLDGRAHTAVNFAGAKHHAMRDHSSGFCVFADLAVTAVSLLRSGRVRRIAILDIDAHHGDGTQVLLGEEPRVLTFSVHDRTIFPGTGHADEPELGIYNEPLSRGSGDAELQAAVSRFVRVAEEFTPDLILIAMGADGHAADPLSTLRYSVDGLACAVGAVRRAFGGLPILLGGAGGYRPDDETPEAWARMAVAAVLGDGGADG